MKKILILLLMLIMSVSVCAANAEELLRAVDTHRLMADNFEMKIKVDTYINDALKETALLNAVVSKKQTSMLSFMQPENMKGRKIIISGSDMSLIIPGVKNALKVTASQRLIGGISYGDVAAAAYSTNYTAVLAGEEKITALDQNGKPKTQSEQCTILDLTAANRAVSYGKARLWVNQQNGLPLKADFFAVSGKKMTTVYYTSPQQWNGRMIVTKIFLQDQVNSAKKYIMEYFDFKRL